MNSSIHTRRFLSSLASLLHHPTTTSATLSPQSSRLLNLRIPKRPIHKPKWAPPPLPASPSQTFRIRPGVQLLLCAVVIRPYFRTEKISFANPRNAFLNHIRSFSSHGSVSFVISPEGKPKFETREVEPPKKEKWQTKKRLKMQRKKEKQKRKAANKRDPRRLNVKGTKKKQRFATAEERIKYKLERAKMKEASLIERLKKYEVPEVQGPIVKPHELTGEERFYIKKMAQKKSNYVPVGRRGIFGGVILNMHLHWKKHETVKVICKPCKPGQLRDYTNVIARLSGGIPIQTIGDDTIVFYRGKDYVQPEVMSPIDTLSKKRALEKSKYEQSLESVRRFIAIAEKELELYYRHVALYGDPNDRNPHAILENSSNRRDQKRLKNGQTADNVNPQVLPKTIAAGSASQEVSKVHSSDKDVAHL